MSQKLLIDSDITGAAATADKLNNIDTNTLVYGSDSLLAVKTKSLEELGRESIKDLSESELKLPAPYSALSLESMGSIPKGLLKQIPLPFAGTFGGSDGKRPVNVETDIADETFHICDGTNGTPDLRARFILGGDGTNQGTTGGSTVTQGHTLTVAELASHSHSTPAGDNNWSSSLGATQRSNHVGNANTYSTGSSHAHSHNQNLPPHYIMAYIIKVA